MKRFAPLVLLALCTQVQAEATLVIGKEQGVRAPFCTSQADAEAIARADSEEGIAKAREILASKDCGSATAYVNPKRITYSGKTARGTTVRVIEVEVEMVDDSRHLFYMIADVEIHGLVET